jgi:hypothetical protein
MSFKKSSSKVEGECPSGGVARQARERLWDSLPKCRSGSKEGSRSSPTTTPKCYCTSCRLGKARPKPQYDDIYENTYPLSPQIGIPVTLEVKCDGK